MLSRRIKVLALLSTLLISPWVSAEEAPKKAGLGELARKAQNPLSNLTRLPLQSNFGFGYGPENGLAYVLDIQPILPMKLTEDWSLIHRPIVPIISLPELVPGQGNTFGLGDIQYQLYFTPPKVGHVIFGFGPDFQFPSATSNKLGAGKWCAGPDVTVLASMGRWVFGTLVAQLWSFAGNNNHSAVNQTYIQPYAFYNLRNGWYLPSSPLISVNWNATSGNKWTVPVGGGVGKVFQMGSQNLNLYVQVFDNVVHPQVGPDWIFRFQIQFFGNGPGL